MIEDGADDEGIGDLGDDVTAGTAGAAQYIQLEYTFHKRRPAESPALGKGSVLTYRLVGCVVAVTFPMLRWSGNDGIAPGGG